MGGVFHRGRGEFHSHIYRRGKEVLSQRKVGVFHREWELLQGEVCYTLFRSVGNYINQKQRINLNKVPSLNPPLAE